MRVLEPDAVATWVHEVLLNAQREKPVVAVTTRPRTGSTWIEPKELADALGDAADVVCLETGDATWELADALPPRLDAYGGALRIWWPGLRADSNPYDHKLYFVHSADQAREVFEAIVQAIRGAAPRPQKVSEVLTATVTSISGTQVELEAEEYRGPLRYTGIPLAELVRSLEVGTALRARAVRPVADSRWEFSVQTLLPSPWALVAEALHVGDVVTGRVQRTREFGAIVEVLPTVTGLVHISELDWTYVDSVSDFVAPSQVVPVKVMALDAERRKLELSVKRTLGTDPLPLPSLVPDGIPFSWSGEETSRDDDPASSLSRDELKEQLSTLTEELEAAVADRMQLAEANKTLREQHHDLRRQARSAEDRLQAIEQRLAPELDPLHSERAFLLGVRIAHARLFDEGSRHEYPLRRMRVGPAFLDSLKQLDGVDVEKALEVCAQVAANAAHELASRGVHQLRDGPRGANSRVRSSDRAQAWRCSLQVNTPSARRLHWWSIPGADGPMIEFASVGLHDSYSIPE